MAFVTSDGPVGDEAIEGVFHERDAMEHAVHAIVRLGVSPPRIRVRRAAVEGGRIEAAPEPSSALASGASLGAVVGGLLSIASLVAVAGSAGALFALVRFVSAAVAGALAGAVVAVLVARRVRRPARPAEHYRDFLLRVDARDPRTTDAVRDVIVREGGDLVPA